MGEYYWWMEFLKVLFAYLALVFVYPSILFRNYLKGKGRTFWFGFCVTASTMLISMVVILLGLCRLLNAWVVRILFYGSLILSISRSVRMPMTPRYLLYKVQNRTYGKKLLAVRLRDAVSNMLRRSFLALRRVLRRNFLEILVLLGLVVYGVLYFAWNPLQTHGYGFSDIIVHHNWAYGLQQGKVFVGGIYPEAMHCVAYSVSTLFGIELYSVLLYLQCANNIAFLISVYLLGRELFAWKGSALAMLALYLTLKLDILYDRDPLLNTAIMSRFQGALPQEFAYYTVFLIPAFLMRYLKNAGQVMFRGKKTRFYWDENLAVFTLGIAVSIATHFYATILALFTCLGVMVVWCCKVFHWRRLVPLALSALLALTLSFGPMVLAYASGIPFQNSIFWALNVMKPAEQTQQVQQTPSEETTQPAQTVTPPQAPAQTVQPQLGLGERLARLFQRVSGRIRWCLESTYLYGYRTLYVPEWAWVFPSLGVFALGFAVLYQGAAYLLRRLGKSACPGNRFHGYGILAVICFVMMMALSAGRSNFPRLIDCDRVRTIGHIFMMFLLVLPVDLAGSLAQRFLGEKSTAPLSAAAVAAVICLVVSGGYYHTYLLLGVTRYNAAVDVTVSILKNMPKDEYTLVSTTDELYQVAGKGYHEELLTFLQKAEDQEYYLPTRYLFFYLEKKPIWYYHNHFCDGPGWLARTVDEEDFSFVSVGDQMRGGEISEETAQKELVLGNKLSNAYLNIYNREILESRLALYLEQLEKEYPNELNVYYEDENFICYCLEQNPNRLFNLGTGQ